MSGEVSTSMGNTFLNLMAWKWVSHNLKLNFNDIVVEGDDSLIGVDDKIDIKRL